MADKLVQMRVEQRGSQWVVLPESGDEVLGTHKTKEDAEAQLRAIEASKKARASLFDAARGADGRVRAHVWDYVCIPGRDDKDGQQTEFSLETLSQMVDNFVSRGDELPIDHNHQSNYAAQNGQPAPALGFYGALALVWDGAIVKQGCARGVDPATVSTEGLDLSRNGLFAYRCEVTELGDELLPNYKYLSPTFTPDGVERDGSRVGYSLAAVAATNTPWQSGTEITFAGAGMPMKTDFGPLPPGVEVIWLPVNQAYMVSWNGQKLRGPIQESEVREYLRNLDLKNEDTRPSRAAPDVRGDRPKAFQVRFATSFRSIFQARLRAHAQTEIARCRKS